MSSIILNETPVRTSKNFGINNISVDVEFPKKLQEFNNFWVESKSLKDDVIELEDINDNVSLKYGTGLSNIYFSDNNTVDSNSSNNNNNNRNKQILVEVNSKVNNDIKLFFDFDSKNKCLCETIHVTAKEDTSSTIYILYKSESDVKAFHSGILMVDAEKNAKINVIVINMLNQNSYNFYDIQNNIDERADVRYTIVDFGGKISISNLYSNLIGDESNNTINTIYLGKDDELIDINYIGELRGKKSNIKIEVQGALRDNARKHFKGTIDFKKGCKKATGDENENCMLLSDKAKSLALPMLLCSEEDVEGNHSTSSGKADEKELFYIMSRGFSRRDALKLLVRAKFNSVIETIKDKGIKEFILKEI